MYNSILVGFLVKIWDVFVLGYEDSLVKKIVDGLKNFVSILFRGSIVKNIFVEEQGIIPNSGFYKIYAWILRKNNEFWKYLNNQMKRIGNSSVVYRTTHSLFRDEIEIIRTISLFFLFFGIGLIINNLRIGALSGKSYIVAIILSIGALISINMGNNIHEILNSSYCYNFIKDLFSIDEGGEQWW